MGAARWTRKAAGRWLAPMATATAAVLVAASCDGPTSDRGKDGASGRGGSARAVDVAVDWRQAAADLALPPMSTFAEHCASCHGEGGAMYVRPFANQGEHLREKVEEMMVGPAGLDPTEADVEAMAAYHLTMRTSAPFAAATNAGAALRGESTVLEGEATEGAVVRYREGGAWRDARFSEGRWLIGGVDGTTVVEARVEGRRYRVEVVADAP